MGETPFTGSQAEIAAGHLYQYPPKIDSSLNIGQSVSDWLQTALAKEPADRFPNAMTMRRTGESDGHRKRIKYNGAR